MKIAAPLAIAALMLAPIPATATTSAAKSSDGSVGAGGGSGGTILGIAALTAILAGVLVAASGDSDSDAASAG